MSLAFGFALPHWKILSGGFSPAALFAAGEQGAWYDPSDFSTLFQDPAGTIPVTAVEQAIGLMLDKSKGLVLGPELVTNGTFDSNVTGWQSVGQGTLSWDSTNGGRAQVTATGTGQDAGLSLTGSISLNATTTYVVTITVTNASSTSKNFYVAFADYSFSLGAGLTQSYTFRLRPLSTGNNQIVFRIAGTMTAGQSFYVDNYSLQALPGNHATAYNSNTARPILSARYNRLTYSEEFSNAAWTKYANTTVSADAAVAPNGTTTADLIYPATSGAARGAYIAFTGTLTLTTSLYAKASGKSWLQIVGTGGSSSTGVWFNVLNGTVGTQTAGYTGTITNEGNGWYRCVVSHPSQTNGFFEYRIVDGDNVSSVTANGTDGLLWWGADGRLTADTTLNIPAYQRIAAATDYDTSGFPVYIDADGSDDGMSTASIDFTGTPQMTVFAGVTKLSDAAVGIFYELSANWNSNAGTFVAAAPENTGAAGDYTASSRGSATVSVTQQAVSATTLAPVSNVFTATHDIPGDLSAIRLNGVASGTNGTGDKGTGNFGNYPLYLFSRNNSSFRFRGRVYSLIIRGASTTTPLIQATESWINQKMRGNLLPVDFNFLTTADGDQLTTADGDPLYTSLIYP